MPSTATITTFYSFSANTKARSSQVNNNFSAFRGHVVPVNADTQTASDGTHDLGSSDHRWRGIYGQELNLEGLTSTSDISMLAMATTAGGFNILQGSTTIGSWGPTGYLGSLIQPTSIPDSALVNQPPELLSQTFLTTTTWVVPALVDYVIVEGAGGGAGGGGGGNGTGAAYAGGGGGGGGAAICTAFLAVTPGQTLTVSIGGGGSGGATATDGVAGSVSLFDSITFLGGTAGKAGVGATPGAASSQLLNSAIGGAGGAAGADGSDGGRTQYEYSQWGAGGSHTSTNGGGGGGGGNSYGKGALGGAGSTGNNSGSAGSSAAANSGAGGGGGGGAGISSGTGGAGGSGGSGFIRVSWVKTPT